VFILVLNTVGRREGVILIPKRTVFWNGVYVFTQFWGERDKILGSFIDWKRLTPFLTSRSRTDLKQLSAGRVKSEWTVES
jgi:hypothetical protein